MWPLPCLPLQSPYPSHTPPTWHPSQSEPVAVVSGPAHKCLWYDLEFGDIHYLSTSTQCSVLCAYAQDTQQKKKKTPGPGLHTTCMQLLPCSAGAGDKTKTRRKTCNCNGEPGCISLLFHRHEWLWQLLLVHFRSPEQPIKLAAYK